MKKTKFYLVLFVFCMLVKSTHAQKFEGLALTPPMGWNSWNKFNCDVNEKMIRDMADAMVASGLKDAGYEYINIDDCWHGERDSLGFITAHPEHFPSGIKALADYVHSKGLKFGIYSCAGDLTCAGKPAGRGHEFQDALMYAKWGVDYLKYDWCHTEKLNAEGAYMTMRDALYAAGRPIVFSLCEWGSSKPWLWAKETGQLWRTTGDIENSWDSWTRILDLQKGLRDYAGPDHWNDPDMLEVGNGMPTNSDRAHFSMWCMLAAPLICGNDLRNMTIETLEILGNKEMIAVNQDALGVQGFKYADKDSVETWFKPLQNGDWALCVLNRSGKAQTFEMDWKLLKFTDDLSKRELNTTGENLYLLRNLWLKKEVGNTKKTLKTSIPAHDVLCLRIHK